MWTVTIYLRMQLPVFFSDPPGSQKRTGQFVGCRKDQEIRFGSPCSPIWPCSQWGLPCQSGYPELRCALTAPFHPYRYPLTILCRGKGILVRRYFFCGTFPVLTDGGCYPPLCPVEPGLSSLQQVASGTIAPCTARFPLSRLAPRCNEHIPTRPYRTAATRYTSITIIIVYNPLITNQGVAGLM